MIHPAPDSRSLRADAAPPALDDLLPLTYDELRSLAREILRHHRHGTPSEATSLVHQAYARLARHGKSPWADPQHFLRIAARAMRYVLTDQLRRRTAAKRGGGGARQEDHPAEFRLARPPDEVLAVDEALRRLAEIDARKAQVIELRFFGGLTLEECADVLGASLATVKREAQIAKAWLYRELDPR